MASAPQSVDGAVGIVGAGAVPPTGGMVAVADQSFAGAAQSSASVKATVVGSAAHWKEKKNPDLRCKK